MDGSRIIIRALAVVVYVVGGSIATIAAYESTNGDASTAFLLIALALLFLAALAAGTWWSVSLPFVPVITVWIWDTETCEPGFLDFCGVAPIVLAIAALFVGVPVVVIGTGLSPFLRRDRQASDGS